MDTQSRIGKACFSKRPRPVRDLGEAEFDRKAYLEVEVEAEVLMVKQCHQFYGTAVSAAKVPHMHVRTKLRTNEPPNAQEVQPEYTCIERVQCHITNTKFMRICYFVGGRNQLQWLCHVTCHIFKIASHGFKTL